MNISRIIKIHALSIILLALLALVYFSLATVFTYHFITYKGYYGYLADAFMHRQTSLLVKPNPKLFTLTDVYDPVQSFPYRLHDASFYKGKYYLYWGPVPALTRIVFANKPQEGFFVFLYTFISSAAAYLILKRIKNTYFTKLSSVYLIIGLCFIAFNSIVITFLPRAGVYPYNGVYYESIAAAQGFFLIGLYYFLDFFLKRKRHDVLIANIFFSLSIGSRISYLLPVAAFIVYQLYVFLYDRPRLKSRSANIFTELKFSLPRLVNLLVTLSPIIIAGIALASYNHIRFGSFTETGISYQLAAIDLRKFLLSSVLFLPNNIKNYLLGIPMFVPKFPFLSVDLTKYSSIEDVVFSVFIISPICVFVFYTARMTGRIMNILVLLIISLLFLFLPVATFQTSVIRYMFDFIYMLSIISIIVFFDIITRLKDRQMLKILFLIYALLSFIVMLFFAGLFWFMAVIEYHPAQYDSMFGYYIRTTIAVYHVTGNPTLLNNAIQVTGFFQNNTKYILKDITVDSPYGIDLTADGDRLWVTDTPANFTILSFEKLPHKVILHIPVAAGPDNGTASRSLSLSINGTVSGYTFAESGQMDVAVVINPGKNIIAFTASMPNQNTVETSSIDSRHLLVRLGKITIENGM